MAPRSQGFNKLKPVCSLSLPFASVPQILGYSIGNEFSLVFENAKDRHYPAAPGLNNDTIKHAAAHEAGHQFSFLAGTVLQRLDQSPAFQTAWQRDMAAMAAGVSPVCRFIGPVENSTSTVSHSGVFSSAHDRAGNLICDQGDGGNNGNGTSSSLYGGDSVAAMKAAYPYFGLANLPLSEVFLSSSHILRALMIHTTAITTSREVRLLNPVMRLAARDCTCARNRKGGRPNCR